MKRNGFMSNTTIMCIKLNSSVHVFIETLEHILHETKCMKSTSRSGYISKPYTSAHTAVFLYLFFFSTTFCNYFVHLY